MTCYEMIDLSLTLLNIIFFGWIAISLQKTFSNEEKVKELIEKQLDLLENIIEILEYEESKKEYLSNKRKINNILSILSSKKVISLTNKEIIDYLRKEIDELFFSLEEGENLNSKHKNNIRNKIPLLRFSLYGIK